ncbi:condensation domain-containing protein, partial [Nostoc sp. NIES-2111]
MDIKDSQQMLSQIQGFQLSPQQQRLWLLQQDNAVYCALCAITIQGSLRIYLLKQALQKVVDRNEILRTKFYRLQGTTVPSQVIESSKFLFIEQEVISSDSLQQVINHLFIQEQQLSQSET